jgi:hypothetical protein
MLPTAAPGEKINIRFLSGEKRALRCAPRRPSWPLRLRFMLHRCFPEGAGASVYTIKP